MNNATDQFVDSVYDALEKLYEKDKNFQKHLLGNEPIKKLFDVYSDWLANNLAISPKVAANTIYRDAIGVGYMDFTRRKIKRGVSLKGEIPFNLIYGTQKEIDQAIKLMTNLKNENPNKYELVLTALEKIKEMNDNIKPVKNIFGKTTNVSKLSVAPLKMPQINSLLGLLKMDEKQIQAYLNKFNSALAAHNKGQ